MLLLLNCRVLFVLGATVALICRPARADFLDITQTGAELLSNGNVTFHETATAGPGSSIQFLNEGPNFGANSQFLFSFNFLPAAARGNTQIFVDVDFTALADDFGGGDHDLGFGIHDGTNIVGIERSDNDSGRWMQIQGSVSGILSPEVSFPPVATNLGAIEKNTMNFFLPDSGGATGLELAEGAAASGPLSYTSNALNSDKQLTFFMRRAEVNGSTENYQINSIRIRAVPEPSGLIVCLSSMCLVLLRRRR